MDKKKRASVLIILLLIIFGVLGKTMAEEKYDWLPTESADYNYPMQIVDGRFLFHSQESVTIPNLKIVNNGWGNEGSTHLVGDSFKPIPKKLTISWFSYTEDKFYSGTFDLPYKKIQALFEKGYLNPVSGEKTTYSNIIVGMAPGGDVSLWLSGHITTEVANFIATQTDIAWERILENPDISRKDYIEMVLDNELGKKRYEYFKKRNLLSREWMTREDILKQGVPYEIWSMYRERYLWEVEIVGDSKPTKMWVKSFNGEKQHTKFLVDDVINKPLVVPQKIDISWRTPSGEGYSAVIVFEEKEIFQAFQKYHEYDASASLMLRIEIGDLSPSIELSIRSTEFILKLENIKTKIYRN